MAVIFSMFNPFIAPTVVQTTCLLPNRRNEHDLFPDISAIGLECACGAMQFLLRLKYSEALNLRKKSACFSGGVRGPVKLKENKAFGSWQMI